VAARSAVAETADPEPLVVRAVNPGSISAVIHAGRAAAESVRAYQVILGRSDWHPH
jgi:hypothetical protein